MRFETERIEPIFTGHVFSVERRRYRGEQGPFDREIVCHPGAVAVVPLDDDGRVGLIEQFRSSVNDSLLEIPAGTRDVPGEDPMTTAHRELREEMGLVTQHLELVGAFLNSPGYCDQRTLVYVARDLREVEREPAGPEEVGASIHRIPLDEAITMIEHGAIVDGTTIYGLLRVALAHGVS